MPDAAGTALLELAGVSKSFGRVVVADNLSLSVGAGDLAGIVGPNGAGKSSLFGLIAGDLAPSSGEVSFAGAPVTGLDPAARCRLGIGRTFQVPKPFGAMTVFENVLVAVQQGSGLRRRPSYAAASAILDLTGLSGDANSQAERLGLLSRKRLEVAQLVTIVSAVRAEGVAIIWIEHVVHALTAAVHRLLCLYGGAFIGDGEPEEVLALPAVREVFLGTEVSASLHLPGAEAAGQEEQKFQ